MGISTNGDFLAVFDVHFHHGRFLLDEIHHSQDDLVDVYLCQLLAVLETLNHVLDEFQCHAISQFCAIV